MNNADITRTAWTTEQNSQTTPESRGGTCSIPYYVLDANHRFPKAAGASMSDKYFLMSAPDDIADAFGDNWECLNDYTNPALVNALRPLMDKYGPLINYWLNAEGPAMACRYINMGLGPAFNWPTSFGSFDFSTLAPGESALSVAWGATIPEAPVDAPVPKRWNPLGK